MKKVKLLIPGFLLSALFLLATPQAPLAQVHCPEGLLDRVTGQANSAPQAGARALPKYKTEGQYVRMSDAEHEELASLYRAQGVAKPIEGTIERVTKEDLVVDFNDFERNPGLRMKVDNLGMKNLPALHRDVLAAGLWSRGAGEIKALAPVNIDKLLTPAQAKQLLDAQAVGVLTDSQQILDKVGFKGPVTDETRDSIANTFKVEAQKTVKHLSAEARKNPRAVTFADLQIIDAALNSKAAKTYVSLDFYVGEDTHSIVHHIADLRKNYMNKIFDENETINGAIKVALGEYFTKAEAVGDTMILAYQEGFYPLHTKTLQPIKNEPVLGAGAGTLPSALKNSGRLDELLARGKAIEISSNIEVVPHLAQSVGAFKMSGTTVNVQLAPTKPGYAGGNAFKVTSDKAPRGSNYQLVETALLPKDSPLKEGNPWFNTNTITRDLKLEGHEQVDFELKSPRHGVQKVIRAKVGSGAITEVQATSVTGIRTGQDYENFKDWQELFANGEKFYETIKTKTWRNLLPLK